MALAPEVSAGEIFAAARFALASCGTVTNAVTPDKAINDSSDTLDIIMTRS